MGFAGESSLVRSFLGKILRKFCEFLLLPLLQVLSSLYSFQSLELR